MIRRQKTNYTPRYDDTERAATAISNSVAGNGENLDDNIREQRLQEQLKSSYEDMKARAKRGENVSDELAALRLHLATAGDTLSNRVQESIRDHKLHLKRVDAKVKDFDKNKWNHNWNEIHEPDSGRSDASLQELGQKNSDNDKIRAHQQRRINEYESKWRGDK